MFYGNLAMVFKENISNLDRLLRLSWYEVLAQNQGTLLGFSWNFINPAMQIFVYWFVFAIGLKSSSPVEGYSYLLWLIVGIVPWFYISESLLKGTVSINTYATIIKQMKFPIAIVPTKAVLSCLISHMFAISIVFFIFILGKYPITWYTIQIFYYLFYSFIFLLGCSFLLASISVMIRDFQKLVPQIVRFLFYMTPILWSMENLPEPLQTFMRLNPVYYIVEGYRESFILGVGFWEKPIEVIWFWGSAILLLSIGINVYMKFRRKFVDFI